MPFKTTTEKIACATLTAFLLAVTVEGYIDGEQKVAENKSKNGSTTTEFNTEQQVEPKALFGNIAEKNCQGLGDYDSFNRLREMVRSQCEDDILQPQ